MRDIGKTIGWIAAMAALALTFAVPAAAAPGAVIAFAAAAAPPPSADRSPEWVVKPTADDLARYFPEGAQRAGIGGRAVISCVVALTGELTDCQVIAEDPPGYGFGEAAVKASAAFRMLPAVHNGVVVDGGRVRIPITFPVPEPMRPAGPITVTDAPMAGDWRAIGQEQADEGNPVRFFFDAASITRQGGVARMRMMLATKTPAQMPPEAKFGDAPVLALGAIMEIDCDRPRARILTVLILLGPPTNGLKSVAGLETTDWQEDDRDEPGIQPLLRQAACVAAPASAGVPAAPEILRAREAWLAGRR